MPIYCNTFLLKNLSKIKEQHPPPSPQKKNSVGRLSVVADQPAVNRRVAKRPWTILPIKMKKGGPTVGKCEICSQDC